ncbi:MAG: hypothetical protein V3R49_02565 [Gammaproteobacteria bacterium]
MVKLADLPKFIFVILLLLVLSACSDKKSPEYQIRQFVTSAVAAAESRETLAIRQLISEQYMDDGRRDRRALTTLAMGYFLRHKNIHLFTQISEVKFPTPNQANVKLYAAMAGRPVASAQALIDIRADLYQFDLMLARDGDDWLLQKLHWQRASIEDIVGGEL